MQKKFSNNKGAIELSANFIIIIIISSIIVIGGLALFFKMKNSAQQYVDTIDQQTEGKIKSMMLDNGGRIAVYPQDPVINAGGAHLVGIGITNIYDDPTPVTFSIDVSSIKYYDTKDSAADILSDKPSYIPLNYYTINSNTVTINPHDQVVKSILIKIPKGSLKGQYVYTISITNQGTGDSYGVLQVYASTS